MIGRRRLAREARGTDWTKKRPDSLVLSGLHGHFDAFSLLLVLVKPDGTEAHTVAVIELAAGFIVQLHHIGQRHSVALKSGRRIIPANGIDPFQIVGPEVAVEYLIVVGGIRFSEALDQILVSDEAHGNIHFLFELPDAAAFQRLYQLIAGYLSGCSMIIKRV